MEEEAGAFAVFMVGVWMGLRGGVSVVDGGAEGGESGDGGSFARLFVGAAAL